MMAGRGRGGRGGRGYRTVARAPFIKGASQFSIQPHNEEIQAQLVTPTSRHPIRSAASCSISRKVRGSYKCITVDEKTKNGKKIVVEIPDNILRAVGEGSRNLVNYIGYITRCTCPLKVRKWSEIWEACVSQILTRVKKKFEVGRTLEWQFDAFINATAQRCYRTWRSNLHEHYSLYNTDEERLAHPPPAINDDDWKHLVSYFGSEKFKGKSSTNLQNRAKQIMKHTCGSRSFAEVEESTRNPETGEKTPIDQIWELQHTRKTKEGDVIWSDAKSQEVHSQLHEIVAKQSQDDAMTHLSNDEILMQVLGQRTGFVRGKGYGVKPPPKRVIDRITPEQLQEQKRKLREEVVAEVREEMKIREAEVQEKVREEMRIREERMQAQFEEKLQAQMASLIASLQQGQIPTILNGSAASGPTKNTTRTSQRESPT